MAKAIKIETTDKSLSIYGGLVVAKEAMDLSGFRGFIASGMPAIKSGTSRSVDKFESVILGGMAGAECLDDLARLSEDPAYEAMVARTYSAKSYGDYFRSFTEYQCKTLQYKLAELSYELRAKSIGKTKSFTLDLDSTSNQQYGKKMEGVEENYKGISCLDTLKAYDEYGFTYWHDVRPGATNTCVSAAEVIHAVFSRMPESEIYRGMKRFLRADSGYCNVNVFNACKLAGPQFVTVMRENMFEHHLSNITKWRSQNPKNPDRIRVYDGRECEIGETYYFPEEGLETLRIVCLRAEKKNLQSKPLFADARYDYFAWVTNIPNTDMSVEDLILFYRGRGNAENFIREDKNGFDLKHYPCLKLLANKAFGIATSFAAIFMRYIAIVRDTKVTHFSKLTRHALNTLPVHIVRHGRQVIFRFMKHHHKEVLRVLNEFTSLHLVLAKPGPQGSDGRSLTS